MGVFSKLKGIFYDEVEVESDDELKKIDKSVKKEKTKEKIEVEEKPKIEEIKYKTVEIEPEDDDKVKVEPVPKTDNTFSERDLFRSDRTFDIIQFDDDEEEYICCVSMDEDDYIRLNTDSHYQCPYYQCGDEYKIVRHQM